MKMIVAFDDDQMMALLEYLENQADAGYTLQDIIEGIKDGSLTKSVTVTDVRYKASREKWAKLNTKDQPIETQRLPRMPS